MQDEEIEKEKMKLKERPSNTYTIRPNFKKKFRPALVRDCINTVLNEQLAGKEYSQQAASEYTKSLVDLILNKVKDLGYDRYKLITQVFIGEQRGQTVKVAGRKFWDPDTDNFAIDSFTNETMFCVAMVFGIYYY